MEPFLLNGIIAECYEAQLLKQFEKLAERETRVVAVPLPLPLPLPRV